MKTLHHLSGNITVFRKFLLVQVVVGISVVGGLTLAQFSLRETIDSFTIAVENDGCAEASARGVEL